MYICIYIYIYMYVCIYVHTYIHMHMHIHIRIHTHTCIQIHTSIYLPFRGGRREEEVCPRVCRTINSRSNHNVNKHTNAINHSKTTNDGSNHIITNNDSQIGCRVARCLVARSIASVFDCSARFSVYVCMCVYCVCMYVYIYIYIYIYAHTCDIYT